MHFSFLILMSIFEELRAKLQYEEVVIKDYGLH